eukprot:5820479-Prymnesium_polylepis.1
MGATPRLPPSSRLPRAHRPIGGLVCGQPRSAERDARLCPRRRDRAWLVVASPYPDRPRQQQGVGTAEDAERDRRDVAQLLRALQRGSRAPSGQTPGLELHVVECRTVRK